MEAVKTLDSEIISYLGRLSVHEKEVVLSLVKTFAGEEGERGDDNEYRAEIERRTLELETGTVKGVSLKELETMAKETYRLKKEKVS